MDTTSRKKGSYDFYLIIATTAVLAMISAICIWSMFYFKLAAIHEMTPAAKIAWQNRMNSIVAPFLIALIILLGICVPKRLLPTNWLNRFAGLLVGSAFTAALLAGLTTGLLVILCASLALQLVVLALALAGSEQLNFATRNYWSRLGSSLVHLGLILFILDLFLYHHQTLHLILFWVTTAATTCGMICCFYAGSIARSLKTSKEASICDQ